MNSSLELLDRSVSTAVAQELGEPVDDAKFTTTTSRRHRRVAGLVVVSNAARDAAVDPEAEKLFRNLSEFRTNSQILLSKLSRVGVKPVAILPLSAWEQLCDRTGLFRFQPDKNGSVRISTKPLEDARSEIGKVKMKSPSPAFAWFVPPLVISLAIWLYRSGLDAGAAFFLIGVIVNALVTIVTAVTLDNRRDRMRAALLAPHLHSKTDQAVRDGSIRDLLWPNYREPDTKQSKATIRIALPEPPTNVQQTLIATERGGITLRVAVVGDAITLLENPVDALMAHHEREIEEKRQQAERDPIVYATEGNAVAIIAQYGDFPIEQKVIEEVVSSIYLA